VVGVSVVNQSIQRHQPLDEQISKLHKESKLRHAGDEPIEILANPILHELHFLPLHQLALSIGGPPLRPARLFRNLMQLLHSNRPAQCFMWRGRPARVLRFDHGEAFSSNAG
jgi:hypothetical protein